MDLSGFKSIFWLEYLHRLWGRLIGLAFLIPVIYFTFKINFKKLFIFYLIFLLICFQGFIGWYMVSSGLINRVDVSHFRLSLHLIIAFIILSLILWNYLKLNENKNNKIKINNFYPYIFLILIFIQITIGAFVSGMDAGLIYNTWPLMGENYFPDDNRISNLFHISVFNNASLVQFIHRNLAYVILLFYILILLDVYRNRIKTSLYPIILLGILNRESL